MQYTNNYRFKKAAQTDGYDIDVHNFNYDLIDEKIKNVENKVDSIQIPEVDLVDSKVVITDIYGKFASGKLDGVLNEVDDRILNAISKADNATSKADTALNRADEALAKVGGITLTASKVKYTDTTGLGRYNVQTAINVLATTTSNLTNRVSRLETEVNDTVSVLNTANNSLEVDVGNPV